MRRRGYEVVIRGGPAAGRRIFKSHQEAQHYAIQMQGNCTELSVRALQPHIFADLRRQKRDDDRWKAYQEPSLIALMAVVIASLAASCIANLP